MTIERLEYTAEEVRQNDGRNGTRIWIIVRGIVYDVTDYLDKHPGGTDLIIEYAGNDATEAFDDSGHTSDAKKILKKYEIGALVESTGKNKINNIDADNFVKEKSQSKKGRRKFLSTILGPCAVKL